MPRTLTVLLSAAALFATGAQAQTAAPIEPAPAAPFEVVRMGDSSLSCEALITEIGSLNQQMAAAQQEMMAASQEMSRESMASLRQRPGGGLMSGIGGMAASMVPGGGLLLGAVQAAGQQAQAASARDRQAAMDERIQAMTDSAALFGPISQRVDHLSEIARRRSC